MAQYKEHNTEQQQTLVVVRYLCETGSSPDLAGLPFPICTGMGVDYNNLQDSFNAEVLGL